MRKNTKAWHVAGASWRLVLLLCMGLTGAITAPAAASTATPGRLAAADHGQSDISRQAQLAKEGYLEQEWKLLGQAQPYTADGDWGKDGPWAVKPQGGAQSYETRVVVRRPQDPARFNGTVVVEWLNTALGFDLDGGWILARDEIVREGYAWVGVSTESDSVVSLKKANPTRYAQAKVAHDSLSYDIYTQAARAIRQAASQWGAPTSPRVRLLAQGYSQSGSYLITYINAFQPVTHAFDGFYLLSTAAVAMPIDDKGARIFGPQYRTEPQAPVIQVSTEMEVMVGWQLSKTPDTDSLRHWEIAGASHFDKHVQAQTLTAGDHGARLFMPRCFKPSNTLPARLFNHAALHALRTWASVGTPPPIAPRMQRNSLGFIQNDDVGNALGGLRLPDLDVPLAQYGMYSNFPSSQISFWSGYACIAGGSANRLDDDTLRKRYPSDQAYWLAYKQAADKLLTAGFLRPADHAQLLEQARSVKLPH